MDSLPLYTMRGHSHLGFMGYTMVLLSLELVRVLPIRLNENNNNSGKSFRPRATPRPSEGTYASVPVFVLSTPKFIENGAPLAIIAHPGPAWTPGV